MHGHPSDNTYTTLFLSGVTLHPYIEVVMEVGLRNTKNA